MTRYLYVALAMLVSWSAMAQKSDKTPALKTYSKKELLEDFDLMVSALKEGHAGLYWYNSVGQFDSLCRAQRATIKAGMDSYDFFRVISYVAAATKEGHCRVASSRDIGQFFNKKARFLPFYVKIIDKKIYLLSNLASHHTKGFVLKAINDEPIAQILKKITDHMAGFSDGYNLTGKYQRLNYQGFSFYYADFIATNQGQYKLTLANPATNTQTSYTIPSVDLNGFRQIDRDFSQNRFRSPIELKINSKRYLATLSVNSFNHRLYDKGGDEDKAREVFRNQVKDAFDKLRRKRIKSLVIDLRNNGGGTEGYEDYLASYLIQKPYRKYAYVQSAGFTYSFLRHTQYNTSAKQKRMEQWIKKEHYRAKDGRILRRPGILTPEPLKTNAFKGRLYVLISGKTYSGGADCAAIIKANTQAIFIGEETGGGFYGKSGGISLYLSLPNTHMRVKIPTLKYAIAAKSKSIPFGRGVMPDHQVVTTFSEYMKGTDAVLKYALKLIDH